MAYQVSPLQKHNANKQDVIKKQTCDFESATCLHLLVAWKLPLGFKSQKNIYLKVQQPTDHSLDLFKHSQSDRQEKKI